MKKHHLFLMQNKLKQVFSLQAKCPVDKVLGYLMCFLILLSFGIYT